ncbi:unnamed protein product [Prunus armeniaca]
MGVRKTLAHRTMPSAPLARLIAVVAPGRKRDREASSTEAALAESVAVEMAVLERPRKKVLLVLSEAEDEEEIRSMIVSETPLVTATPSPFFFSDNLVLSSGRGSGQGGSCCRGSSWGAATAEVAEMLDAEAAVTEVPVTADVPDDEVLAVDSTRATLVEVLLAASVVPTLAITASVEPLPVSS